MRLLFLLFLLLITGCTGPHTSVVQPDASPPAMVPEPEPGHPTVVIMHVDIECPPADRSAMKKAADIWKSQTGQLADIRFVYDLDYESIVNVYGHSYNGNNTLTCVPADSEQVTLMDAGLGSGFVYGWVLPPGGVRNAQSAPIHMSIVSERMTKPNTRVAVYLHEFGHVLGIKHQDVFDTIMWPTTYDGKTTCLKERDLAAYCEVNDCGTTQTYPCK